MHRLLISVSLAAMLLTGCGDRRILEELGFIQTAAYDEVKKTENGKETQYLHVTVNIPVAQPDAKNAREVLSTVSKSIKKARIELSRQTDEILVSGQLRNTLFGLDLAKSGMWSYIDTLLRDPSVGHRVKVTVVNGNAHHLLSREYSLHPRIGEFMDQLLEKESRSQTVPETTVYHFARDYFDDGIDPVVPIVREGDEAVFIDGIALFRDDKYVTKLNPDDALLFAFLRGDFKQGDLSLDIPDGGHTELIMFSSLVSNRKIQVERGKQARDYKVTIEVEISGSVLEYMGELDITKPENQKLLEKRMSAYLTKEGQRIIDKMQTSKVDSLGIGKFVRNKMRYKEWKAIDWHEEFPKVEVKSKVVIGIKDYGKFK